MKFAKVTNAPKPRVKMAQNVAIIYAVLLVLIALLQLFKFEDFSIVFSGRGSSIAEDWSVFIASTIVFIEVFSLPSLLRMPLSRLFRGMSYVFAVAVPVFWLVVCATGVLSPFNLGAMIVSALLLVLAVYSVYGLQGSKPHRK